jgi:hypothetical protein
MFSFTYRISDIYILDIAGALTSSVIIIKFFLKRDKNLKA